ncbi:hypothetical protein GQ53DRAFT_750765 [Thozetella sp. PMI_491]|nr:hypothetical protein GQ53DRAFT_750765 [Thozetella sp. PMI_491]
MAPITMYDASVAIYISGMKTLLHILQTASKEAGAESLPDARLYEDMRTLTFQVQAASNTSKKSLTRLTGKDYGSWEDKETTMPDLIARVEKTLNMLESVDPKEIEGADEKLIALPTEAGGTADASLLAVTLSFQVPNFFFHLDMAYAILRSRGVPIGKNDYLAAFNRMG